MGERPLGEADKDPVTINGCKPATNFLLALVLEFEVDDQLSGARRRRKFDECDAVLADAIVRLAVANTDQVVCPCVLDIKP